MLISAIIGMAYNFYLCSIADSYKLHRLVYIFVFTITTSSFTTLLILALTGPSKAHASLGSLGIHHEQSHDESIEINCDQEVQEATPCDEADLSAPWRYYLICSCIIAGSMSMTTSMSLADAFTTNVSKKCGKSYGSIRAWGAAGWILSSVIVSRINEYDPFLAPCLTLYVVIATLKLLIIIFWPDKSPFDMSEQHQQVNRGTEFNFAKRFSLANNTVANSVEDLTSTIRTTSLTVQMMGANQKKFDLDDDNDRNVRRSSQTTLEKGHIIKQYELDNNVLHFNHVTKIEKLSNAADDQEAIKKSKDLEEINCSTVQDVEAAMEPRDEKNKLSGFRLNTLLVFMIISRNMEVMKTLLLFSAQGFCISMLWYYQFPYLDAIDGNKFKSLSANIMIYSYISELCFYYASPFFLRKFNYSVGLSLILFVFGIRYYLYVALAFYSHIVALDFIILIELLQALNVGWYECIYTEAANEYALKAREYIPELVEKGIIGNTKEEIELVNNGVKSTMVAISSCFYDGFGVALGSLTGGYLIDLFGYNKFWIVTGSIALSFGAINLLIDGKKYLCDTPTNK